MVGITKLPSRAYIDSLVLYLSGPANSRISCCVGWVVWTLSASRRGLMLPSAVWRLYTALGAGGGETI